MSDQHIKTITGVYEAFGRGDVEHILEQVTDDVDWASEADSRVAPWHGVHRGKAELPHFFQELAANVEVTEFTPLAFTSNDTDVMTAVRFGMAVPATGKSGTMEIRHWFRFRGDKIEYYRGTEDTAMTAELLSR
ncbi:MAG: nuclear transport factor 2 family protein [Acidimicrobiia bacterium]|nr:nuclear transport factor 2 family protein [Acidimicrobiia bacterium]